MQDAGAGGRRQEAGCRSRRQGAEVSWMVDRPVRHEESDAQINVALSVLLRPASCSCLLLAHPFEWPDIHIHFFGVMDQRFLCGLRQAVGFQNIRIELY